ncbi:MAG: hypothetical protein KDK27_18280, partial [Leptospiraceae bacterium]|nr:hypothetical protein [Leptospiraceae bacterium]
VYNRDCGHTAFCNDLFAFLVYAAPPSGPRFIAVGNNGSIYYSTNGYSWSSDVGPGGGNAFNDAAINNGFFLAQGNAGLTAYSTNGTDWTSGTISGANQQCSSCSGR